MSDALVVMTFCVSENHIDECRKMVWLFTLSRENSTVKHDQLSVTHPNDSSGKCDASEVEVGRAAKNFNKRSCVCVCVSLVRGTQSSSAINRASTKSATGHCPIRNYFRASNKGAIISPDV